jgi:hypothetical protein
MVPSTQESPLKQFQFNASLQSITSASSDVMPLMQSSRRNMVHASVEIMGLELFLEPEDDGNALDVSESSSAYDSYAPDSIDLMKTRREDHGKVREQRLVTADPIRAQDVCRKLDDTDSLGSSIATDSFALESPELAQADYSYASSEDESSSSDFESDIEDSLQHGYKNRVPRRFPIQVTDNVFKASQPSFKFDDTMKRRASIDNCNMVVFSADVIGTQYINNGGANAAA